MISALKHIVSHDGKAAYRFTMNDDSAHYLSKLLSDYVSFITDSEFSSLQYYRSLRISL